jgi:glycosyltransferase involved in cell wall biosynthesis
MNGPLVSVLMTCYNREKYIASAIESVLNSSYKNFELIIVDDCSTDNTYAIVEKYALKDSRIKKSKNIGNLGDYENRNMAASYASGKYLKYVDSDDYIYPWGLSILVECMEKYTEAGWGLCSLDQNDLNPFPFYLTPYEAYKYHYFGPGLFHKAPLSSILRRDVFIQINGFSEDPMTGDFEFWHKIAQTNGIVLMPHGIVWHRTHSQQEGSNVRKYIPAYEKIKVRYLKDNACPLSDKERMLLLKKAKQTVIKHALKNILKLDFASLKLNIASYKAHLYE